MMTDSDRLRRTPEPFQRGHRDFLAGPDQDLSMLAIRVGQSVFASVCIFTPLR